MDVRDHKEDWTLKKWCFWTVILEKSLESPLDSKEIQRVHPKANQSWICIGRTHVEAETPILWPPDAKNWLIWKDPDAGKDWRQEKGTTENEMVGWHHRSASAISEDYTWPSQRGYQKIAHPFFREMENNCNYNCFQIVIALYVLYIYQAIYTHYLICACLLLSRVSSLRSRGL